MEKCQVEKIAMSPHIKKTITTTKKTPKHKHYGSNERKYERPQATCDVFKIPSATCSVNFGKAHEYIKRITTHIQQYIFSQEGP